MRRIGVLRTGNIKTFQGHTQVYVGSSSSEENKSIKLKNKSREIVTAKLIVWMNEWMREKIKIKTLKWNPKSMHKEGGRPYFHWSDKRKHKEILFGKK